MQLSKQNPSSCAGSINAYWPSSVVLEWRREASVVSDSLGVVRRVESAVGDIRLIVAERGDLAEGAHDLQVVVYLNDPVVVLIANQCIAIAQADSARRKRASACTIDAPRIAVWIGVGEILGKDVAGLIGFDNAAVARVGDNAETSRNSVRNARCTAS